MRTNRVSAAGGERKWRHGAAAHGRGAQARSQRRFAWAGTTPTPPLDASSALRALSVHERALAAACNALPTDGQAQQLVFLAAYHLLAVAAGTAGALDGQPSERVAKRGAAVIGLGSGETDVALGFVRLLPVTGWHRFTMATLLDWTAEVRKSFVTACASP